MKSHQFTVEVTSESAKQFAELSGDWNPLHTDKEYAESTTYKQPILHGAFSAGLVSQMAGMHLPGKSCLLHGMRLKFLAPILYPRTLSVSGKVVSQNADFGQAEVSISDSKSGTIYVEASYEFSHHQQIEKDTALHSTPSSLPSTKNDVILVTGANGALGQAILNKLGERGLGVVRKADKDMLHVEHLENLGDVLQDRKIGGIVHCAWPGPDNQAFSNLNNPRESIHHHVSEPLLQVQALSKVLRKSGIKGSQLILIGSTASDPGRHNYRMPLYSLSKALIPTLVNILSVELAPFEIKCSAITFDVLKGGMNASMSRMASIAHSDRSPFGYIPTVDDAADQVMWLLQNQSRLTSGATFKLSGGALP